MWTFIVQSVVDLGAELDGTDGEFGTSCSGGDSGANASMGTSGMMVASGGKAHGRSG